MGSCDPPTGVPPQPTLTQLTASDSSITVSWRIPVSSSITITGYWIEYRVKVEQPEKWPRITVNSSVNSHVIMELSPFTTYTVRVFAVGSGNITSVATPARDITTKGTEYLYLYCD